MIGRHGLNQRVGRAHLGHHRKADRDEQSRRDPERTREREQNQADAEDAGGNCHPSAQAAHALARGQSQALRSARPRPRSPSECRDRARPEWKIWSAKTGMSTAYGMPVRLTRPKSSSKARMGAVCATKRNPSTMWLMAEPFFGAAARRDLDHHEADDHGDIAHAVREKAPALADGGHQNARDRRAHDARAVEHRRVERDGVDEIFAPHHLDQKGLARRNVECVDHAEQRGQHEDVPDLHAAGQRERRPG